MRHPSLLPVSKLAGRVLTVILALALGCGSSDEGNDTEPSSANGGSGGNAPTSPAATTNGSGAPGMPSAEDIAAVTDALGMAADQIQAACGAAFDRCETTPGCNEILTCAARNACAGRDCYCLGADCTMDGPCRSVIDAAPGARLPDENDPSLGPASDAARGVGDCLQEVGGGGLPPLPMPTQPASPAVGDAGVDAG